MIQRLNSPSLSFKGDSVSPREAYDSQMINNSPMAQKQTNAVANLVSPNHPIPMQGVGQKLDVIA